MPELNSSQSGRDFARRKKQAEQEMKKMHSESQQESSDQKSEPSEKQEPAADEALSGKNDRKNDVPSEKGIFSKLFSQSDTSIILALLLLLMDDEGDHSLVLALLYLLL